MSTFEQRIKNFIQEGFTDPPAEWEFFGTENNEDVWKDFEPRVKTHEQWTHTIPGRYGTYFILEECVIEIERKAEPGEEWKDSPSVDSSKHRSQYSLWICVGAPKIKDGREEYGYRLVHVSWNPYSFNLDTNGIEHIKIDLISPVFRPNFDLHHYLMDFVNRVVEIPFHDS